MSMNVNFNSSRLASRVDSRLNKMPDKGKVNTTSTPKCSKKSVNPAKILAGIYIGLKGITSGVTRIFGVRLEEHTTSAKNAKEIIKNNCVLDPKFGGTGCSKLKNQFVDNSKKYIHITGAHCDYQKVYKLGAEAGDIYKKGIWQSELKAQQKLTYKATLAKTEGKNIFSKIKEFLTSKTFYIGGTDEYFNKNFIPDTDEIALKTKDCIKVQRTKIGATIEALKKQGLSGIRQNPKRFAAGVIITALCFAVAYKLIKGGINNKKIKKNKNTQDA